MCRSQIDRLVIALLVAGVVIESAGCGGSGGGTINGTLTRKDGMPLVRARVVARSSDTGATAYGSTNDDGDFNVGDGLAPGDYVISILEDRGDPDNRRKPSIAVKYSDATKSEINVSVKPGKAAELKLTLDPP